MSAASAKGPLDGIRVIDLTRVLAGPYCTMVLADLGAEVIKVERPVIGDDARHIGPFMAGKSAYFMSLNRGKQSIALNLKDHADRETFLQLLEGADVLVENFRPGTMEKLGLGWDMLKEKFPRLVFAAVSGFGQTGPYAQKPAYDMVVQAMGGIMSLTGHPGSPPTRVGSSIGDITAGLFTAIGINAALFERESTGKGKLVDVSMLDCQVAILENALARYTATGEVPGPLGARHPSITPFEAFATSDKYIVIAAGNDALFKRLCESIGADALADDARFGSNEARCTHAGELKEKIETALASKGSKEWLEVLEAAGIPCGPINNIEDVLADPQVAARNMIVTAEDKDAGPIRMGGNPIKLSGVADPSTRAPAPELDEHREAILATLQQADQ